MIEITNKTKCCGCHACYNICPKGAIKMQQDEKGFKYPVVDKDKCINCGLCNKVCPIINNKQTNNEPKAYACYNKDLKVRIQSSSGGIFTLLAEEILNKGGVVFGASFNKNFEVEHIKVEKIEELEKLRGSKYTQSNIGEKYKKAKEILEEGRYVLFTGTPCQIEGLKKYLQKDYKRLYTQDIICHGVPSPKVWKKYLEYRENKDNEKPQNISFRNKDNGWKLFNTKFEYSESEYKENQNKDLYMQAFLKNTSLRDSCYNCSFKKKNRISDITLADFWGIENLLPEMNDNKGISLVIVNSLKGQELFEKIKDNIVFKEVELEDAIQYNKSMIQSVKMDKNREKFFENLDKMEFDKLVKKYTYRRGIIRKILSKIKRKVLRVK